jgi:hypothetical protein
MCGVIPASSPLQVKRIFKVNIFKLPLEKQNRK